MPGNNGMSPKGPGNRAECFNCGQELHRGPRMIALYDDRMNVSRELFILFSNMKMVAGEIAIHHI